MEVEGCVGLGFSDLIANQSVKILTRDGYGRLGVSCRCLEEY